MQATPIRMLKSLRGIASLRINISLKTVQLPPPIFGHFCEYIILLFCPLYLGIPVLTKYFVKIYLFVSWGRPQFLLFYLNIRPLLHPKYMTIFIKAFPQSFRYCKYLSFATLDTPVTVLGAVQLVFSCKEKIPPNFSWRSSEHEQKPKLVFVEAE